MTIRLPREAATFRHPFRIRGMERFLPAGACEVVTAEEAIEGLSFLAKRRIAGTIAAPVEGACGAAEVLSVGSVDLAGASGRCERRQ